MMKQTLDICRQQTISRWRSKAAKGKAMLAVCRWRLAVLALALSAPTLAKARDQECGNVDAIIRQAYPGAVAQGERSVRTGTEHLPFPPHPPSTLTPSFVGAGAANQGWCWWLCRLSPMWE